MAKTITITFNQDGSLVQNLSSAAGIRQGDGAGEVTFNAVFQNQRNDLYVAKLHYQRPDGKTAQNLIMTPSEENPNAFVMQASTSWFFAVPGTARATVTITSASGIAAQGSYSFEIEDTDVSVADSTMTYDEAAALEGLISALDAKSVKRATKLTIATGASALDFYEAIRSYYDAYDIEPEDGDRFYASFRVPVIGNSGGGTVSYAAELCGEDKVFISERSPLGSGANPDYAVKLYMAHRSKSTSVIREIAFKDYVDSFFDQNGNALRALADEDGARIVDTYDTLENAIYRDGRVVHLDGTETITGPKTFSAPTNFKEEVTLDKTAYAKTIRFGRDAGDGISAITKSHITFTVGPTSGYYAYYKFPYDWNDGEQYKEAVFTITTDRDLSESVSRAKSEAIASAASTAQQKVDALAEAMDFSNGAFGEIVAGKITVRDFIAENTKTTSSAIEDPFFEYLKGNESDISANYAGSEFTKYNGVNDFFLGLHGHEAVFGKANVTRDLNGNITGVSDISLIPILGRAAVSSLTDGHVLAWDATTKKAVDGGFTVSEVMSVLNQEDQRVANENGRIAAERVRQINVEDDIKNYPYSITQAQYDMLEADGVFGVHFNEQGVKVVTVYATQAAAVAAGETYVFPMVAGLDYPAVGIGGDSPYLNIPPLPQEDGDYVLKGHVASGVGGYAWEADE